MKRVIKSATKSRSPRTAKMWEVLDAMGWRKPMFVDPTVNGYAMKWGNGSFEQLWQKDLAFKATCAEYGLNQEQAAEAREDYSEPGYRIAEVLTGETFTTTADYREFNKLVDEANNRYKELCADPDIKLQAQKIVENILQEIYDKTGIKCKINRPGYLIIPYGEDE